MFIREDLNMTVASGATLLAEREDHAEPRRVAPKDIKIVTDTVDPVIRLGRKSVPLTEHAMAQFGDLLQIPSAFLKRMDGSVQNSTKDLLLNDMIQNTLLKDARVMLKDDHMVSIDEWGKQGIAAADLLTVAGNVISTEAPIARWIDTPSFFGFDVYAPEGFAHGYGGDGVTAYGDGNERDDITAGGLRFGVNLKQGLAPFVQEWMFRLACTNGYETENSGLKVDARGQTVDEVLAELESVAQVAFGAVERNIASFYELKNQPVENVERTLLTIARERDIPNRSTMALLALAAGDDLPDDPSMFDVVNLVTNFANSPKVNRDGGRLILEGAGGAVISDHAARCGHCQQKVS